MGTIRRQVLRRTKQPPALEVSMNLVIEKMRALLESSQYKDHLHDVDGVYMFLNPEWKKVLLNVSGGADSAMMAYLISDIITKNKLDIEVHIISLIRMWETRPWQRDVSLQVFEYLQVTFPHITYVRHNTFIPPELEFGAIGDTLTDKYKRLKSGDQIIARSFMEYVAATNNIDAGYAGITLNPPAEVTAGLPDTISLRNLENIDTTNIKDIIEWVPVGKNGGYSVVPFRYVSKDWIVKQYKDLGILDLFNITRSCEGEFEGLDSNTYHPGQYVPVCGKCFWCVERAWAQRVNEL